MPRESLAHLARPQCCARVDVGYVFWSVAVAVANRQARRQQRKMRVRIGDVSGWVVEPCN